MQTVKSLKTGKPLPVYRWGELRTTKNADFRNMDLTEWWFPYRNLEGADFTGAKLPPRENFRNCKNIDKAKMSMKQRCHVCGIPVKGGFYGWKKGMAYDKKLDYKEVVIKLWIPRTAKRVRAGRKCRASHVWVEEIRFVENGKPCNQAWPYHKFTAQIPYDLGEITKADKFDGNPNKSCGKGINFFLTRKEAKNYG